MSLARPRLAWLAAALAAGLALGCNGHFKRGSLLYADGRYIEAAEVFERTEYRLAEHTPREKAEYGLYRGMTLLVLGDTKNAQRWLAYAYEIERSSPGSLRADRRAQLDRSWFELGQRLRSDVPAPSPPSTAVAASGEPAPRPLPRREGRPEAPTNGRTLVPR